MAGAGRASDTNTFGRCCVENRRQIISIPLDGKKYTFFQVWEKSVGRRGQLLAPDHVSTGYFRSRHLHSLALAIAKQVGRGFIPHVEIEGLSSRELLLIRVLPIVNVKAQVPPRAVA